MLKHKIFYNSHYLTDWAPEKYFLVDVLCTMLLSMSSLTQTFIVLTLTGIM
jgi:hypothetical protein